MKRPEVSGQCSGLCEGHAAQFTLEGPQIHMALIVHDQARALHKHLVARLVVTFSVHLEQALEVSVVVLSCSVVHSELSIGVAR